MKKFCTIFFITLLLIFSFIVAEASSIQKPALWPAIKGIELTNDGGYIFTVNVRAYCPNGIEGDLLVAAYDANERLLDVVNYGIIAVSPYTLTDNCSKDEFLEKTSLTSDKDNTISVDLKLKDKNYAVIKAFVINLNTLKPEIESGEIEFIYDGADSYVNVDYTLKSDYKNEQIDANRYYYYYYYYDGNCTKVDVSFVEECSFSVDSRFYFLYYDSDFNEQENEIYTINDLRGKTITFYTLSGIKIANHINHTYTDYSDKFGFETQSIKVYCDFSKLN